MQRRGEDEKWRKHNKREKRKKNGNINSSNFSECVNAPGG